MKINLLKQKDFFLLILGKLVSNIGSQMQSFALSLYVLAISGSAIKFASVLAITIIPKIILGPIAGVFADWLDRKKLMVVLDILSGIIVGIFAVLYSINGRLNMPSIYFLSVSLSLIGVIFQPVTSTILPSIVKKEDLVDANALKSFVFDLGSLMSPIIAGILFGSVGIFAILIINSISFILSGISEAFIDVPKNDLKPDKITLSKFIMDFKEGIIFIKSTKIIFYVIILALFMNFAFSPVYSIGITYISKQIFKISDFQYGLLESISTVAIMLAPFIASKIYNRFKKSTIYIVCELSVSILIGLVGISATSFYTNFFTSNMGPYITIVILTFIIGIILTMANIVFFTMIQQIVPLKLMGRVTSVTEATVMAVTPLGQMLFGVMFDIIAPSVTIISCSVMLIVVVILFIKPLLSAEESLSVASTEFAPTSLEIK